jgi:hypothetical protein
MKNPFKPERSAAHRDNPAVPNVVERPLERSADRAVTHDNPVVPNAIERPVERAAAGDRGPIATTPVATEATRPVETDATRQMDLFPDEELRGYRTRWEAIQTGFVDQPRAAVEQADALVSQVVTRLTDVFTRERSALEGQWAKGDDVSTEDLRVALTRYRSFFHRLLSM